ncbi:MAG TPA: hypothetical protein VFM86_03225, partial [Pedococcus sp.]|nr:hypothetical protein [Pedococcus sp.]
VDAGESSPVPARSATSVRAAMAVVGIAFGVVVVLLVRGGSEPLGPPVAEASPSPAALTNGIVVYAAPADEGAARLWLWDLAGDVVRRGPLVPQPDGLVNVGSSGYGWIGITTTFTEGMRQAAVLDSFDPGAAAERVGFGDIVAWTREGRTVVLVDRGPIGPGCRREIEVVAIHVAGEGSEGLFDEAICGDVRSVGRTSLGFFATLHRPDGADIVGLGYRDAGVVLPGHALIGISPGGEMLVTPAGGSIPGGSDVPEPDPPPTEVRGPASLFSQFGGRPQAYLVGGEPFIVDRVLAYAPGSVEALVVGRPVGREPAAWALPLHPDAQGSLEPVRLGPIDGFTSAAYAADGTAFVVTGVRLWVVRDDRLMPLHLPDDAPLPRGPVVWVLREPLTQL